MCREKLLKLFDGIREPINTSFISKGVGFANKNALRKGMLNIIKV